MCLAWMISARNGMIMNGDFSPNQKILGRNVRGINNIEEMNPAQLKETIENDKLGEIMEIQRKTKEEWLKLEYDNSIKRALKDKIKMHKIEEARLGDRVFYKREKENKWRGLGKIIGIDGKTVIVKYGALLRNVNKIH